jgi:hypothetical protein
MKSLQSCALIVICAVPVVLGIGQVARAEEPTVGTADLVMTAVPGVLPPVGAVTRVSGTAYDVGREGRISLAIVGTFLVDDVELTLDKVEAVTITSLIDDGESDVASLPLRLLADPRNSARTAYFSTPVGAVPSAKIAIGARGHGVFTFRINVRRGSSEPFERSPFPVNLVAGFVVEGLAAVSAALSWEFCSASSLQVDDTCYKNNCDGCSGAEFCDNCRKQHCS